MTSIHEHIAEYGPTRMSEDDLVQAILGRSVPVESVAALAFWSTEELKSQLRLSARQAATLVAVFELGRRVGWMPPLRGERCLDPSKVYELMRRESFQEVESFFIVMLDVRGRLIGKERIATGSLTQCPVNIRDTLRPAVKAGAHGIVFVHNHPSGDPTPSCEDSDLTDRLRAGAELVGILPRDHVIVAAQGYYSFVEAGRWRG